MTAELVFTLVLGGLCAGLAAFVIFARDHFAATVGFVALGLVLSLVWMVLAAPDVAMTEAALGGGVMGALLLMAEARLRGAEEDARPPRGMRWFSLLLSGGVAALLAGVVLTLPAEGPSLAPAVDGALARTGLGNPVTAVLMSFRALDTMLEKVVLLLALVAVWSLATGTTGTAGAITEPVRMDRDSGPQGFLARAGIPFGLVIGGYIFWVGADAPGGAFAGGAIISAMLLLAVLAGEGGRLRTTGFAVRGLAGLGVLVFVLAGLGAMALGMPFLSYPADWAKPVIVVLEIAMTLSVGVTLALLVPRPPQTSGRR